MSTVARGEMWRNSTSINGKIINVTVLLRAYAYNDSIENCQQFLNISFVLQHLHVRHLDVYLAADTVTDWRLEFFCGPTAAMDPSTDRDPEERHHLRTLLMIT